MTVEIPEKLSFIFENHRYKILWGGRGAGKSENIAQAFLILGMQEEAIFLCTREVQRSIRDSVHALLRQWIAKLGLEWFYSVTDNAIRGLNGTEFIFWGLSNIDSLKSLARVRYCWVEEGQSVKKASWDKLIPTIRWEDRERGLVSEIWVSMNPELSTDDSYKRFVLHPPPTAKVVNVNWRDNPWFPEVLKVEMEEMKLSDYDAYLHVYEGHCKSSVDGAIFKKELAQADAEGRIGSVPYNRARPVETIWDLGFGDLCTVWFCQPYEGWFHFIDYMQGSGETIHYYLLELQKRGYLYGTHWIPHDGIDTIIHHKLSGGDRSRSIEMLMRAANLNVRVVPKLTITDRINAGRTIFPQCKFDREKCAEGLDGLRNYQWGPADEKLSGSLPIRKREPLHDYASHAADSFTEAGVALKMPAANQKKMILQSAGYAQTYAPLG